MSFVHCIVLAHHPSNFPKTTKHLVSWWVPEQVSPHSEASGSRDFLTVNTKVGSFSFSIQDTAGHVQANVFSKKIKKLKATLPIDPRHRVIPHDPGVRLPAI